MVKIDFKNMLCNAELLHTAWLKVLKNGGVAGGDGISLNQFQLDLNKNLKSILNDIEDGKVRCGPYKEFLIPKKSGKIRKLSVPCVSDRIIHTLITLVLTPILEPQFEDSSFAYRSGRSVKQAVSAIERWRDAGFQHVIDADITNYFDTIDHKILLSTLKKHLRDHHNQRFILDLVEMIIDHQGVELESIGKGLAQGSPLSPLLANLYLDYLDERFEAKGIRIVRFADDFVILCKNDTILDEAHNKLKNVLAELNLELNPTKTRIIDFDRGFEFLGYLFVRSLAMQKSADKKQNKIPHLPSKPLPPIESPENFTELTETKGRTDYSKGDRILYILERGRKLLADRQNYEVQTQDGHLVFSINMNRVDRIEIGPNVTVADGVIQLCLEQNIQLVFLNGWGEQAGRLLSNEDDRPLLQFAQAKACLSTDSAAILSRLVIEARIRNQRTQLFRLNRRQKNIEVDKTLKNMGRNLRKLPYADTVEQIRGLEGASAALYWPALGLLCSALETPFRRTRPAKDPINASINYLTSMLERDIRSAIRSAGLHAGFGFLHKPNDYSEAAIYDLMERFRAPLTEGLVVFLFNAKRLRLDMFEQNEKGGFWMNNEAKKAIINGYETLVANRINIPAKKRKLSWRRMMWYQANSLAKAYRKDNPSLFTPYLMEA